MIVSFFDTAFKAHGGQMEMPFDGLAQALKESSFIPRASSKIDGLTALMISPAIYEEGQSRSVENAIGAEFTALDFDAGDWTVFAAASWCRVRSLAHIVHTTRRSRPQHHRFRMVLPFSRRIAREEYPRVWTALDGEIPAQVDQATKDISRLSIFPHLWEGAFNWFLSEDGEPLDVDKLLAAHRPPRAPISPTTACSSVPVERPRVGTAYAAAALRREEERVREARVGERNSTLIRAAFSLGQLIAAGLLERTVVVEILTAASALPSGETRSVIQRGIAAGLQNPRN